MADIKHVIIIYNPNSTGDGQKNARHLQAELKQKGIVAKLVKTTHAGHGEELARDFASAHPEGMIISSSGDGGYHEVINGVLSSKNPKAITGLLPSGNANDHYNFVHHGDISKRIKNSQFDKIDVLKVVTPDWTRYAHSYVGLGLTPAAGKELTEKRPGKPRQFFLAFKHLVRPKTVTIRVDGQRHIFSNLVFSNIGHISKYFKLAEDAVVDDGLLEITRVRGHSATKLFGYVLRAGTDQIEHAPKTKKYSFQTIRAMPIQLDGEVYSLKPHQKVTITCEHRLLYTIV